MDINKITAMRCSHSLFISNKTLREVGADFGVSAERVRTLERAALRDLRKSAAYGF